MLETKDLRKVYKPKKGVPVTALDGVTIKFPEKGMVFLLGKSGSGKSTLLHLLGGLDKYDGGEIIIKGASSKGFRQKHFDSYRNTYVGFIFQDYNVLDEFSVGANIALAIELQGRKASDKEINEILHEVGLDGFGNRKPNELSGGQKQRVAIARALVKKPQIIMADEPTGALDSATGKQVFDTLKKLSRDKLVIVVSHDRDFAEQYADRIIELSDGKVISDIELLEDTYNPQEGNALSFNDGTVHIPGGYHLTEDDRIAINEYIDKLNSKNVNIDISEQKFSRMSKATDESKIKYSDNSEFRLIKSKLPLKSAVKIGSSGLKHKKIRLVITILLSCVAFVLFGLADTFAAYDHIKTCTNSIIDTEINYASLVKSRRIEYTGGYYYSSWGSSLSADDLAKIKESTGVELNGVYKPFNADLGFSSNYNQETKFTETEFHIYAYEFNGFATVNDNILSNMGYEITAGRLPDGTKKEIGISKYVAQTFIKGTYADGTTYKDSKGEEKLKYQTINSEADMIGKVLTLGGEKYTVTCIIDTDFDLSRYEKLTVKKKNPSAAEELVNYALSNELQFIRDYSYVQTAFVGDGFIDRLIENTPSVQTPFMGDLSFYQENKDNIIDIHAEYLGTVDDVKSEHITWLKKGQTTLGEKEIIVSSNFLPNAFDPADFYDENNPDKKIEERFVCPKNLGKFTKTGYIYNSDDDRQVLNYNQEYTIAGYIDNYKYPNLQNIVLAPEADCNEFISQDNGPYQYCVGKMPAEKDSIKGLVSYCYSEDSDIRYDLMNSVTYELGIVNESLNVMAKVFLYIGLGFALFAAIMLANFIGTSISYKKQEIGILRAIGSRSNDVFRIFFSESFIIAMINFALSAIGVFAITEICNYYIRCELGVLITVLGFGVRQIALLFAVSIVIAFIASFLPVKRIASKRPIDAIRDR